MCKIYNLRSYKKNFPFVFLIKLRQKTLSEPVIKATDHISLKTFFKFPIDTNGGEVSTGFSATEAV